MINKKICYCNEGNKHHTKDNNGLHCWYCDGYLLTEEEALNQDAYETEMDANEDRANDYD